MSFCDESFWFVSLAILLRSDWRAASTWLNRSSRPGSAASRLSIDSLVTSSTRMAERLVTQAVRGSRHQRHFTDYVAAEQNRYVAHLSIRHMNRDAGRAFQNKKHRGARIALTDENGLRSQRAHFASRDQGIELLGTQDILEDRDM